MKNKYGGLDITNIGIIVRNHPELVRKHKMKDGTEHMFLNIDTKDRPEPDQFGSTGYIKVSCKKENQKPGINYFLANLKDSQFQDEPQSPVPNARPFNPAQAPAPSTEDDLPFDFRGVA